MYNNMALVQEDVHSPTFLTCYDCKITWSTSIVLSMA